MKIDAREGKSPGFKFNEWEVKGVPLRIEIGPKDLAQKQIIMARRDTSEKKPMPIADCTEAAMHGVMDEIHATLLKQAQDYLEAHTIKTDDFAAMQKHLEGDGGMVWAPWDGTVETANAIKDKTKATIRLLPETPEDVSGKKDIFSGKPAVAMALYAKAY